MFGIFTRLRQIECGIEALRADIDCQGGGHQFELKSGYDNGLASTGRYVSGKKCRNCGKFIELVETALKQEKL